MDNIQELVDKISGLTVLDASKLVKELEEKLGVSAAPVVAAAAPAGVTEAAEEQLEFEVMLDSVGSEKIKVIKEVRAVTGLGLKEAKSLVESSPASMKKDVSKEEGEKIKKQLEAVGASVSLK